MQEIGHHPALDPRVPICTEGGAGQSEHAPMRGAPPGYAKGLLRPYSEDLMAKGQ